MKKALRWLWRKFAIAGRVTVGNRLHLGIGSRLWAPEELRIGDDVYIGKWCTIECNGEIGDGTLIANSVGIVGRRDHDMHQVGSLMSKARWVGNNTDLRTTVTIGPDCWIGYGATILGPVSIGASSVVAAGSVVVHDVPPNSIVGGIPAKLISRRFSDEDLATHWKALGLRAEL